MSALTPLWHWWIWSTRDGIGTLPSHPGQTIGSSRGCQAPVTAPRSARASICRVGLQGPHADSRQRERGASHRRMLLCQFSTSGILHGCRFRRGFKVVPAVPARIFLLAILLQLTTRDLQLIDCMARPALQDDAKGTCCNPPVVVPQRWQPDPSIEAEREQGAVGSTGEDVCCLLNGAKQPDKEPLGC